MRQYTALTDWLSRISLCYLEKLPEPELLTEALEASDIVERRNRLGQAYGFLGLLAERNGRETEAREYYEQCTTTNAISFTVTFWAMERLRQMKDGR